MTRTDKYKTDYVLKLSKYPQSERNRRPAVDWSGMLCDVMWCSLSYLGGKWFWPDMTRMDTGDPTFYKWSDQWLMPSDDIWCWYLKLIEIVDVDDQTDVRSNFSLAAPCSFGAPCMGSKSGHQNRAPNNRGVPKASWGLNRLKKYWESVLSLSLSSSTKNWSSTTMKIM